ncbi:MAG: FAD-dependent oxidoreductase [Synergistaceae bacterium]|nr:FAD-dependent oxidoreductase [Synergistaceae bacterium]
MKKVSLALLLSLLVLSLPRALFASSGAPFDVAVVGAGCGGAAAAIQAARMGMNVALIEESDWIGGQMTGAAVSTMDDVRRTRTGIYKEFLTRASDYYEMRGTPVNLCYWGSDTFAFEPWVAQKALEDMIRESGRISLFMKSRLLEARTENKRLRSIVIEGEEGKRTISAHVFIDATETGDLLPLAGARYRSGNSLSPAIDNAGVIQDITYVAVVKKYPEGLPPELKLKRRPPGYEKYLPHFREITAVGGDGWPGEPPYSVAVHNAYRAMPDVANPRRGEIDGGKPGTWPLISRTAINWANDYPGRKDGEAGMSVRYLEDKKFRREADREAMAKTLCFLFYMQNELGLEDWSVDNRQGYGGYFCNDWEDWEKMPPEFAPILKHFPPFPYVRESRRVAGIATMAADDVQRDAELRRALETKADAIALGEYPTDIHGLRDQHYLDTDLNEHPDDIPADEEWKGGLFQIPMGVLIPEELDGLLAAEKNISVSRIVNGSTRLQPVTMLTGQAAGALAAAAARGGIEPREVRPVEVQSVLLDAGVRLSLFSFEDVPRESLWWKGVELATLHGYMEPASERIFGVDNEMHWLEVRDAARRALGRMDFPEREYMEIVTLDAFRLWLTELFGDDAALKPLIEKYRGPKVMSRGELAAAVGELLLLNRQEISD